jgi:hypothetical protein
MALAVLSFALFCGGVAAVGAAGYAWSRARPPKARALCRWRCPRCATGVPYPAGWAGRAGTCPGCRGRLSMPTAPRARVGVGAAGGGFRVRRKTCAPLAAPVGPPARPGGPLPAGFQR